MKSVKEMVEEYVLDLVDDMLDGAPNNEVTWSIWDRVRAEGTGVEVCGLVEDVCEFD